MDGSRQRDVCRGERLAGSFLAMLATIAAALGRAEESPASWPEAMVALRAGRPEEDPSGYRLGPWYATAPLAAEEFTDRFFPEDGISLDERGEDGRRLWEPRPEWEDDRGHPLPGSHRSSTYLYRRISATAARRLEVSLGSDDGIEVFLRGRSVLSRDVARGLSPDQDRVTLELERGENDLLLKIHNQGGGHGFHFSAGPSPDGALWRLMEERFPAEAAWMREDAGGAHIAWFAEAGTVEIEAGMVRAALGGIGSARDREPLERERDALVAASSTDPVAWLSLHARCARVRHRSRVVRESLEGFDVEALRLAIRDLSETFPDAYPRGAEYLARIDAWERKLAAQAELAGQGKLEESTELLEEMDALRREALMANPLLDFGSLLLVKRRDRTLGLPQNWQGNCSLPRTGYDNEIAVLSPVGPEGTLRTLYRPDGDRFVGDVDLHFTAERMLVSMPGSHERWQIWEIGADGGSPRQVTPGTWPDVDSYDACYLPDERIIFGSTACFQGVPCVGGGDTVANLFIMERDGTGIRQLCFDQDHDWCPTVLGDGRVLYSRWEYSDAPHYFTRLLFQMNPDGTNQSEYYASNSHWPNSIFYARPLPGHPTRVVAVISGHHGVPRMGELVIFDPARGRHQAEGAVQRIPGRGKRVEPIIRDALVDGSWPRFLHPWPLGEKHFLVSCQPTPRSSWGIYLVDVFDNMLLLQEEPGYALLEPVPLRPIRRPPAIPDRIVPGSREATVYLADVYVGKGLRDVPRGTVKRLRVYELHYAYPGMGGHIHIGIDGPWDVRRILGTVDVAEDGSALFRVPSNTPVAVQPLDAEGKALQVMRSWFTAMPGETLSCVGCHESQNTTPGPRMTEAGLRQPSAIAPWYGPARGFSFRREVQPVLDEHCVRCHDGTDGSRAEGERADADRREGGARPDFTAKDRPGWGNFTPSYIALHPYVRRPGPESDYFPQQPLEFHASTSELVQMLEKGHHGTELDREAWDRLITWIDLNVPDHGTWHEHRRGRSPWEERRREMRTIFANRPEDPEAIVDGDPPLRGLESGDATVGGSPATIERASTDTASTDTASTDTASTDTASTDTASTDTASTDTASTEAAGLPERLEIRLSPEETLSLVLVPAGEFLMGAGAGDRAAFPDETPPVRTRIERPFYVGVHEVTNAQYALFDPGHDSAYISMTNKDQSERGHPANGPRQPVVRISGREAAAFCDWVSARSGRRARLPTEAEWEWAARAGTSTPFSYGDLDADFGPYANLADRSLGNLAQRDSPRWHPRDDRFDDGAMVSADVGRYRPNAWGLHDVHGNVAEWTASAYRPYGSGSAAASIADDDDGNHDGGGTSGLSATRSELHSERTVVRGGSWYDRPRRARSSFRLAYPPWQRVFNVGFRVVIEAEVGLGEETASRALR